MITTDKYVYFYGGVQCFSNWHHTPDQIHFPLFGENAVFDSSEQIFMFFKGFVHFDEEACMAAVAEKDPREVKKIGRAIKNYNEPMWNCLRLGYMTYSCYLKFSQNPEMAKELLDTGNKILVEASPVDCVWGIGLSEDDLLIADEKNWRGTNLLGVALMDVRKMLQNKTTVVPPVSNWKS